MAVKVAVGGESLTELKKIDASIAEPPPRRFLRGGPSSLTEIEKGLGRKPSIPPGEVQRIVDATFRSKPKGATHWSCRTMASANDPVPFVWTASVQSIMEKINRCKAIYATQH